MSIYTENGYQNRRDYLDSLADDYGVERATVYAIADLYGPGEDFDGLVTAIEDLGEDAL